MGALSVASYSQEHQSNICFSPELLAPFPPLKWVFDMREITQFLSI